MNPLYDLITAVSR